MAFALSHKGKATSGVSYNPEDGSEAYNNASIHTHLSEYTSMAREVHGPEYDPTIEDLDTEIVMRVGGGKKKGRYCGRTNLNYAGSSMQVLSQGLQRTSNGVTPWPVG
jgi:hypothetical protein